MWKDLTIGQKSEVMRLAVQQGFSDLNNIKEMYDSATSVYNTSSNNTYDNVPYNPSPKDVRYDDGGWLNYLKWKDAIGKYKGIDTDDPAYDYAGFYIENPKRAWALLNGDPNAHFVDTYKTVYHPTFSDESMYSGMVSPQYNPEGLIGGSWRKYPDSFTMSTDLYRSPVSMNERIQYLENNEPEGVVLREYDGSFPMFNDGSLWGGVKPTVEVSPHAYGGPLGNIYKGKGNKSQQIYVSSPSIRKRISNWEGESMYRPAPDTGKVNNPFEKEDAAFWSIIPTNIRPYLTQDMLDALYSTSYNIGSRNFKKRVVPELKKFFIDGTGSIEAIKNSMYGTRDKEAGMSGLRTRRAAERQMFEDAFNAKYPKGFTLDRVPYKTTKANSSIKWDGKKSIQENLESLGVKFIPTSGYRSPKQQSKFKTPAGKSWHTHLDEYGNSRAIDIVPAKGMTFDDLRAQLMSPEVQAAFTTYGLGVLDETNTAMKKKTGATGNHFHIGPDKSARAGYAAWINSKMPNGPQINIESPVFYTTANDLQWQPSIVTSSRQEDIAPLLVQDNKPLIVEPLEDTSSTPKDFSAIWDQIFPKVENTQEEFNPLLDPSTQFTALQSRPRYQMKSTPIINMPVSNVDNDYMLFRPLT